MPGWGVIITLIVVLYFALNVLYVIFVRGGGFSSWRELISAFFLGMPIFVWLITVVWLLPLAFPEVFKCGGGRIDRD